MTEFDHKTVLKHATVEGLQLRPADTAVDCTAGGGGHTELMLELVGSEGRVVAIDRDRYAVQHLSDRFSHFVKRGNLIIVQAAFSEIARVLADLNLGEVRGICADLGVSSPQLDQAERGFSFRHDGPLDMRMDQGGSGRSAASIVNEDSFADLARIFREYGEEPKAAVIAKAIVKQREVEPFTTTRQLAELIEETVHYRKPSRTHKATRVFQALRIAANDELGEVRALIDGAFPLLGQGGRLAIISFHSLEDRIVKQTFRRIADPHSGNRRMLRELPIREEDLGSSPARIIKPFPMLPDEQEIHANERSRSAKLRILEKA